MRHSFTMRPSFIEMCHRRFLCCPNANTHDKPLFKVGDVVYAKEEDGNVNVFGVIMNEPPLGTRVYDSINYDPYRFKRDDNYDWLGIEFHRDQAEKEMTEYSPEELWQGHPPRWDFHRNNGVLGDYLDNDYYYFVRWVPNSGNSIEQVCDISLIPEYYLHKAPDFISKLRESVKRTKQRNIKVALAQVLNSGVGLGTITTYYITKMVCDYC